MYKKWIEEEKLLLEKLYVSDGLAPSEIAKILNRSVNSINVKCVRWNFHHNNEQISNIKSRLVSGTNNGMYGKQSSIKGLTKDNCERIKIAADKISKTRKEMFLRGELPDISGENNPMYGISTWNKGLTVETDDRVKEYGIKISKIKKQKYKLLSEEEKNVIKKKMAYIGANCKKKSTTIEIKVKEFLIDLKINVIHGYAENYFVFDFYIPDKNLVIECNGDYWHSNPLKYNKENINDIQKKNIERDSRKKEYLNKNNIELLELWEYDIRKNFEVIKEKIKDKLK